jgi:hypothetical protein
LRDLTLVFVHLTLPRLSVFLREMPSLTSLELRMSITTTDALLALLVYDTPAMGTGVLPRLERLVLCDREQHFSESAMLGMVESRWGKTPLKHARISTKCTAAHASAPALHRRVLARISDLVEEGLRFVYEST